MTRLTVGVVGCGLIGGKRAQALDPRDRLIACFDVVPERSARLAGEHGAHACVDLNELLALRPDVVIVATTHDQLTPLGVRVLQAGSHLLVEKPAALSSAQVRKLIAAAQRTDRQVKVGFNHRFYPGLARAAAEVHSGDHGEMMHLRGRYGHGGRLGYEQEWRADSRLSGGGELIDQGMHLIDLSHWIAGPLPLHSSLLRTHFWNTDVEDNAALILGAANSKTAPWAMLHVTWTEWKNTFSLEIFCRHAKLQVDGLVRSYGPQRLRIYRMKPELGPPELEEISYASEDGSWRAEWEQFAEALTSGVQPLGGLADALYAWRCIEDAYEQSPYASMREAIG